MGEQGRTIKLTKTRGTNKIKQSLTKVINKTTDQRKRKKPEI
jgi:hypothetical protein